MIKPILFTFLVLAHLQIYGQNVVTASLIYREEGIPFANINVLHTAIRTVSNQLGEFSIDLARVSKSDTIAFSCVGFKTKKMLVKDFENEMDQDKNIFLEEEVIELPEFVFDGEEMQEKTLGNPKAGYFIQAGFSSVGPGDQLGTIIKIKENPTFIESFHADISYIDNDSMKLRLNFYNLKKGRPDKKLPISDIIFETKELQKGRFDLDLREYNIIMTDDFYVSIECLENLDSVSHLAFCASVLNGPIVGKLKDDADWTKVGAFGIGFSVKVKY